MSNASLAFFHNIRDLADSLNVLKLLALRFVLAVASLVPSNLDNLLLKDSLFINRSVPNSNGGIRSGTVNVGELGSAAITNGACTGPKYAELPLLCIVGRQIYAGTDPMPPCS